MNRHRQSRRIDQPIDTNQPSSRLYEPLRRSILKNSLSLSRLSSKPELQSSRLTHLNPNQPQQIHNHNDRSSSRISQRVRSLSPQQLYSIKSNIYIPVNKRLRPTKNLQLVRDKIYQAIDVEEKVYEAIPANRFESMRLGERNQVEEIVYEVDEGEVPHYVHQQQRNQSAFFNTVNQNKTLHPPHYVHQPSIYQNRFFASNINNNNRVSSINPSNSPSRFSSFRPIPSQQPLLITTQKNPPSANIYTQRNTNNNNIPLVTRQYDYGYSTPNKMLQEESSRRVNASERVSTPRMKKSATFGGGYQDRTSFANNINEHNIYDPRPSVIVPVFANNNYNNTNNNNGYEHKNIYNTLYNSNHFSTTANTVNNPTHILKQVPTTDILPNSRTSFQQEKVSSQISKGYDFSRLTSSTVNKNLSSEDGVSEYSARKKEEWKYNLYSIFDEPINTKCSKTGCLNNQIIASRPVGYEWQQ